MSLNTINPNDHHLRDKYLNSNSAKLGVVKIPEWGDVYIRNLSLNDMDQLKNDDHVKAIAFAVLLGVGDANGNRVFSDVDYDTVRNLPWVVVKEISKAVTSHNKLDEKEVADEKKPLPEIVKPASSSNSAAPSVPPLKS